AKVAGGEDLGEGATERVPHDDGSDVEAPDQVFVVGDDVRDGELGDWRRVLAERFDLAFESGPRRYEDLVAGLAVALGPVLEAAGRHPQAMDEDARSVRHGGVPTFVVGSGAVVVGVKGTDVIQPSWWRRV